MGSPAIFECGTSAEAAWESVTRSADATLAGIAHGYTEFRECSDKPVDRREVAGVDPVLIVEFDDPLLVTDAADTRSARMWQSFGAGACQGPTATLHSGRQHCLEVQLTPLGMHRLTGLPMNDISNRAVSLEDLFGDEGRHLPERLAAEPDWAHRFDLLDSMLVHAAANGPEPDPEVAWAWSVLSQTHGTASVGKIVAETGWSRARLANRFRNQIGLTPKAAARVLRFGRAMALLAAPGHRSLASIALACGYFDQAHFNRDFRIFAGCSPGELAALRCEGLPGIHDPAIRETFVQDEGASRS
ncbi:AraC family transcriptional regulator [Mycobacteroides chelonae]|uniref:AraC family transcriptional regulator n=1 Tax=Mycobacteroides chelonae TaxID=1774 RepID=UPI0008AA30EC|nr:helix-turn-helix domain-containing protein [Mycobacteroides chelonae]OHT70513.1 AraC family transcriptional regulator [Mycobacteroides chelonae]OHT71447.1 AraC family transcriptional regulator [Mycobacteroides chelonae]OHT85952.1 AraC family transcriptional regulator [Mycobacteroides chelonae]